jgi:hypothetical protein
MQVTPFSIMCRRGDFRQMMGQLQAAPQRHQVKKLARQENGKFRLLRSLWRNESNEKKELPDGDGDTVGGGVARIVDDKGGSRGTTMLDDSATAGVHSLVVGSDVNVGVLAAPEPSQSHVRSQP